MAKIPSIYKPGQVYLVESGHNADNTAFYRKYSDGYIDQWGIYRCGDSDVLTDAEAETLGLETSTLMAIDSNNSVTVPCYHYPVMLATPFSNSNYHPIVSLFDSNGRSGTWTPEIRKILDNSFVLGFCIPGTIGTQVTTIRSIDLQINLADDPRQGNCGIYWRACGY